MKSARLGCFVWSVSAVLCSFSSLAPAQDQDPAENREERFRELVREVESRFYDEGKLGAEWKRAKALYYAKAVTAKSQDEFVSEVNKLLDTLSSSHTRYFPRTEPKYYQLLGVFERTMSGRASSDFRYTGIGIETTSIDGKTFIVSVYDGTDAEQVGLKVGDEILSINGQPYRSPVSAIDGGSAWKLEIRKRADGPTVFVEVAPEEFDGRTMFEAALQESVRVIKRHERSIGYVHMWSYAGEKYQDALKELLLGGKLADCDALVLDLRDGWGGANVDYVELFREPTVSLEIVARSGKAARVQSVWGKPVALLINERTTSGKELFAYVFKKLKLGKVIGTRSTGAVLAGQPIVVKNGEVMYLAVADVRVDGKRLEGFGVEPDIVIERSIPYSNGDDPQLESALENLSRDLKIE